MKRCRFVKIKNGLSLSQLVTFFRQVLSAVVVLEQDSVATFLAILERCRMHVAEIPWKAKKNVYPFIQVNL